MHVPYTGQSGSRPNVSEFQAYLDMTQKGVTLGTIHGIVNRNDLPDLDGGNYTEDILHHDEFQNVYPANSLADEVRSWYWLRGCFVLLITCGIIISNVINLRVWMRSNTRMPWATRRFLINLSTSDLLVGLIATSSAIYPAFTGHWPFGAIWCQISGIIHGMSVTLSIWSIAMVSLDRYIAAVKPFAYKRIMSRSKSRWILILMWCCAFVSFVAPLFTKTDFIYYQYSVSEAMCGLYWESAAYCTITACYIPILSAIVLIFTSHQIQKNLAMNPLTKVRHPQNKQYKSRQRLETNKRALSIIFATSICYFFSWGPYTVLTVFDQLYPDISLSSWLVFIMIWVANANSMVNVFIYSFTNKHFQQEMQAMWNFKPKMRPKISDQNDSSNLIKEALALRQQENMDLMTSGGGISQQDIMMQQCFTNNEGHLDPLMSTAAKQPCPVHDTGTQFI